MLGQIDVRILSRIRGLPCPDTQAIYTGKAHRAPGLLRESYMTKITQVWPNGKYIVETQGVGMPKGFWAYDEALTEAKRQQQIFGTELLIVTR
jgi:hypothetical protein